MSVFNGKKLYIEIVGESHAEKMTARVKGFPELKIDEEKLRSFTERRKPNAALFSTPRKESDKPVFSGLDGLKTTDDFSFDIFNENVKKGDYSPLYGKPRPSHADYARYLKDGSLDFSGGGRFSGRMTAPLCVIGGLCMQYLNEKGVFIAAYVSRTGKVEGLSYKKKSVGYEEVIKKRDGIYPSLSDKEEMIKEIESAANDGDSVGGIVECIAYGLKGGVGDNLFSGLESKISSLLYAIPGVKGVEFGEGFGFGELRGSDANDGLFYSDGKVRFYGNRSGGINGGISNGQPITLSVAIRPTPSIKKPQKTVDLVNQENVEITVCGRHDACIVPRALPCVESAAAIALTDEILSGNYE